MSTDYYQPEFDLGTFRYTMARLFRLLIRARWAVDPGFLTAGELGEWKLAELSTRSEPAPALLDKAVQTWRVLLRDYLPVGDSGGFPVPDPATPFGRLFNELTAFAPAAVGGCFPEDVWAAARTKLATGGQVDWAAVAPWERLARIRADLDALPKPGSRGAVVEPDGDHPLHEFRRVGKDWSVHYPGGPPFLLRGLAGGFYLHQLLQRPGVEISALELASAYDKFNAPDLYGPFADALPRGGSDPVLDPDAIDSYREAAASLAAELAEAESDNDEARVERLQAQQRELAETLRQATRPGGQPTRLNDPLRKTVARVTKAVKRAIEQIAEKHEQLGKHLGCVRTGTTCRYQPERPVAWAT